jgi:hypothetical protein
LVNEKVYPQGTLQGKEKSREEKENGNEIPNK